MTESMEVSYTDFQSSNITIGEERIIDRYPQRGSCRYVPLLYHGHPEWSILYQGETDLRVIRRGELDVVAIARDGELGSILEDIHHHLSKSLEVREETYFLRQEDIIASIRHNHQPSTTSVRLSVALYRPSCSSSYIVTYWLEENH